MEIKMEVKPTFEDFPSILEYDYTASVAPSPFLLTGFVSGLSRAAAAAAAAVAAAALYGGGGGSGARLAAPGEEEDGECARSPSSVGRSPVLQPEEASRERRREKVSEERRQRREIFGVTLRPTDRRSTIRATKYPEPDQPDFSSVDAAHPNRPDLPVYRLPIGTPITSIYIYVYIHIHYQPRGSRVHTTPSRTSRTSSTVRRCAPVVQAYSDIPREYLSTLDLCSGSRSVRQANRSRFGSDQWTAKAARRGNTRSRRARVPVAPSLIRASTARAHIYTCTHRRSAAQEQQQQQQRRRQRRRQQRRRREEGARTSQPLQPASLPRAYTHARARARRVRARGSPYTYARVHVYAGDRRCRARPRRRTARPPRGPADRQHVRDNADGDGGARQGVRPPAEDAHQVHGRVRLQVLPAALHQALQSHDTRAQPQGRRHLHLRGLRQVLQAPGQSQTAQEHTFRSLQGLQRLLEWLFERLLQVLEGRTGRHASATSAPLPSYPLPLAPCLSKEKKILSREKHTSICPT